MSTRVLSVREKEEEEGGEIESEVYVNIAVNRQSIKARTATTKVDISQAERQV